MSRARGAGRLGGVIAAGLFAAFTMVSLGGCSFLKPKAKKTFSEACSLDTDCESLDCAAQGNFCTKVCTYNKDCGGTMVCRQKDDGTGDHCANPVGTEPNGTCMDPSDCQNGHCLKHVGEDNAPGICSRFCAGPDDCPDGMKICDTISDTGTLKMCLPGNAATPAAARPKFGAAPVKVGIGTKTVPTTPVTVVPPPTATGPVGAGPIVTARGTPTAAPTTTAVAAPTTKTTAAPVPTTKGIKPRH